MKIEAAIQNQYDLLKKINLKHLRKISQMKKEYKEAGEVYENLQSQTIQEEIKKLILITQQTFPDYKVTSTKFGIKLFSDNGIIFHKTAQSEGIDKNSGLGDYDHEKKIFKILTNKVGNILKLTTSNIAWFKPEEDNNSKTSWVYIEVNYEFKKPYLNKKFNFKSTPLPKVI